MARLLHLSDLHVSRPGTCVSGRLDTCALMVRAIDTILNRLPTIGPFDAVLVTGDVSDDGSAESYELACAQLDRFGVPVLAVPGNHDLRAPFRAAFRARMDLPADGPIDWSIDLAGTRIIGLDTLVEGRGGGRLPPDTLDHLSQAMAKAGDRPVVIAMHHPPLHTGIRFMDAIGLENPVALADILAGRVAPVRILAGHVHGVFHGFLGAHSVVTAPSICSAFAFDRREAAPVGFMTGPTGFAVLDTAPGGVWAVVPLEHGAGPFDF